MTTAQFRMAEKTNPNYKAFCEECFTIDPPVDNHAEIQQLLQQDKAHVNPLVPPSAAPYNPRPAPPSISDGDATNRESARVPVHIQLLATVSTNTLSRSHGQDRVIEGEGYLPELSCSFVDYDSESSLVARKGNDHLGNRVRNRSPEPAEAQTTAERSGQLHARDTSDKLRVTSSHKEVEQGHGEDAEHVGPRKPKKRGDLPKTKKSKSTS